MLASALRLRFVRSAFAAALVLVLLPMAGCGLFRPRGDLGLTRPSNQRDWLPSLETLATAKFDGDKATIHNVRNFHYLSEEDFVVDYYDKSYDLDKLTSVDFVVVPFQEFSSLAHTMLSFGFEDRDYVVVSVEARLERNESYSPISGASRQYELIYVIGDEKDLVPLRTEHRKADVYVYRANVKPQEARAMFVDMLERANKLAEKPEFYDTFTNNCTTNLVDHVNKLKPNLIPYSYHVLLPGHSDRLAYDLGLLKKSAPFEELKRRAYVNTRAHVFADRTDFSQQIRRF